MKQEFVLHKKEKHRKTFRKELLVSILDMF